MSDNKKKHGVLVYGRTSGNDNHEVLVDTDGTVHVTGTVTSSGAATIADGADVAEGAKANAAATDSTSAWSVISLLKGLYAKLAGTLTIQGVASGVGVPILQAAVVDTGNSTTVALAGNATFTGASFDGLNYAYVHVIVESDQSSASLGLQVQFSGDNSHWDDASLFSYVAGAASPNAGDTFGCGLRARYYRVVYTNGSSAQGNFRLSTTVRVIPPLGDITDSAVSPTLQNHALLTRSSMMGKSTGGGGTLVDVKVNPSGSVTVDATGSTGLVATVTAAGDVASGSADSGNPVKIGVKAVSALPTALSANQRSNVISDLYGRPYTRTGEQGPAGSYSHLNHNPSVNTKATITKSAGAGTVRNVCTGLTVSLAAGTTAPAAIQLTVALIDGSSGGTTYLWGPVAISLPASAGATSAFVVGKCWKPGSQATAMTLEFSAAGGANTFETVDFDCVQVAE